MTDAVTIVLADDHPILRDGLRSLLVGRGGFTVAGEASTGREAVEMVKRLSPDVVVMDVRMPDLNGIDAARQAIAAKPNVKVIALSSLNDEKSAVAMLRAGAVGYVPKDAAFEELIAAIQTVIKGRVYFNPAIIARASMASNIDQKHSTELTSREREVLQLLAEGYATKEVAMKLDVSVKTAETHRRNIMEKLGIDSLAALTKYAIREGLTGI